MLTFLKFSQGDIAPDSTRSWGLVKTWHFWCGTRADETSANVSTLIARIGRVERSAEVAETHCAATGDWERPWEWIYHRRRHSICDCKTVRSDARQPVLVRLRSTRWTDRSIKVDPIHCRIVSVAIMKPFEGLILQKLETLLSHFIQEFFNNFEFKIHRIGRRTIRLL